MLFTITVLHGVLAVALVGSLGWAALELSRVSQTGATIRLVRVSWVALVIALLTNILGTYSYMTYRLSDQTSARSVILNTAPWVHRILFESMEYIALLVPIMVAVVIAAASIYGQQLADEQALQSPISRLLMMTLFIVILLAIAGFIPSVISFVR
jgi:hypothetical protein